MALKSATVSGSDTESPSFEVFFLSYWNRVKRVGIVDQERISFSNSRGDTLVGALHRPVEKGFHGAAILCHGIESIIASLCVATQRRWMVV